MRQLVVLLALFSVVASRQIPHDKIEHHAVVTGHVVCKLPFNSKIAAIVEVSLERELPDLAEHVANTTVVGSYSFSLSGQYLERNYVPGTDGDGPLIYGPGKLNLRVRSFCGEKVLSDLKPTHSEPLPYTGMVTYPLPYRVLDVYSLGDIEIVGLPYGPGPYIGPTQEVPYGPGPEIPHSAEY